MKRKYKFRGTDGNGGFIDGITKIEHPSMVEALMEEICPRVHSCLMAEAI